MGIQTLSSRPKTLDFTASLEKNTHAAVANKKYLNHLNYNLSFQSQLLPAPVLRYSLAYIPIQLDKILGLLLVIFLPYRIHHCFMQLTPRRFATHRSSLENDFFFGIMIPDRQVTINVGKEKIWTPSKWKTLEKNTKTGRL